MQENLMMMRLQWVHANRWSLFFQRRRCGRCCHTTARLRLQSRAPLFTNLTSWSSTTAPRLSSSTPSSQGRSSASRKWFITARSPVSLIQKVSLIFPRIEGVGVQMVSEGGGERRGVIKGWKPQWNRNYNVCIFFNEAVALQAAAVTS